VTAVADKLREARGYIERRWCRGDYMSANGSVCAVGAIRKAVNGHPEDCSANWAVASAESFLRTAIGRHSIVRWNDEQSSKKLVLAAFDRAIALAESEQ
jgi:hypothetical protein